MRSVGGGTLGCIESDKEGNGGRVGEGKRGERGSE